MRLLRGLAGGLVWIVACVVGLVGALLSLTLVLAPVGIPLLLLARRLFRASMAFFLPRAMRHPAQELGRKARRAAEDAGKKVRPRKSRFWGRKRPLLDRLVDGVVHSLSA